MGHVWPPRDSAGVRWRPGPARRPLRAPRVYGQYRPQPSLRRFLPEETTRQVPYRHILVEGRQYLWTVRGLVRILVVRVPEVQ